MAGKCDRNKFKPAHMYKHYSDHFNTVYSKVCIHVICPGTCQFVNSDCCPYM